MRIYNQTDTLTFPSGRTLTPAELKEDPIYKQLFTEPYVLQDGFDGVTTSFQKLSQLKQSYNVTESDPEMALELIEAAMKEQAEQAEADAAQRLDDITAINARMDAIENALIELDWAMEA